MLADGAPSYRQTSAAQAADIGAFQHCFQADPISVRIALRKTMACAARHLSQEDTGALELILAEVLNNIVEHGYGNSGEGTISITVLADDSGLTCSIGDFGPELPAECLCPDATRPAPVDLPEGGFGWFLIRDLAHDLRYERHEGRNRLVFRMPLSGTARA